MVLETKQPTDFNFDFFKRFSSHDAYPIAEKIQAQFQNLPGVLASQITGELRRGKPTIQRMDMAISTENAERVISGILDMNFYENVLDIGSNHISLHLPIGMDLLISMTEPSRFGSLQIETTGSQNHIRFLTERANRWGMGIKLEVCEFTMSGNTSQTKKIFIGSSACHGFPQNYGSYNIGIQPI